MGYSSTEEVDIILAQALTSARPETSPTQLTNLLNIGNTRDLNRIPNDTVELYIEFADNQVDGILSQQYFTPFSKCANGEWALDDDLNLAQIAGSALVGTDTAGDTVITSTITISVSSANNLVPGNEIIIYDDLTGDEELAIVATIVDQNTFTVTAAIEGVFLADSGVRVIRQQFPPPLNQISARYAASYIYDKYFAAQAQPNISDYGKEMRSLAMGQLNDVLNGRVLLKCARRRGDLFGGPYLDDLYALRDRGFDTSSRDMSRPK